MGVRSSFVGCQCYQREPFWVTDHLSGRRISCLLCAEDVLHLLSCRCTNVQNPGVESLRLEVLVSFLQDCTVLCFPFLRQKKIMAEVIFLATKAMFGFFDKWYPVYLLYTKNKSGLGRFTYGLYLLVVWLIACSDEVWRNNKRGQVQPRFESCCWLFIQDASV